MPKEVNGEEYLIMFCYAILTFILISEPFIWFIAKNEQIRIYGYILFLIGAIILSVILNKKGVKNKNGKL